MAVSRVSLSSITQGFPKSRSFLDGNSAYIPSSFESIATISIGAGGAANVQFNSIPSTFKHLQIRGIGKQGTTTANGPSLYYNGISSGTSYAYHNLYGDGAGVYVNSATSYAYDSSMSVIGNGNAFTAFVIDILDYADTNKYKTTRAITGYDNNGSGAIYLHSNLFMSTNAISQINIYNGYIWSEGSTFALYGIKGA